MKDINVRTDSNRPIEPPIDEYLDSYYYYANVNAMYTKFDETMDPADMKKSFELPPLEGNVDKGGGYDAGGRRRVEFDGGYGQKKSIMSPEGPMPVYVLTHCTGVQLPVVGGVMLYCSSFNGSSNPEVTPSDRKFQFSIDEFEGVSYDTSKNMYRFDIRGYSFYINAKSSGQIEYRNLWPTNVSRKQYFHRVGTRNNTSVVDTVYKIAEDPIHNNPTINNMPVFDAAYRNILGTQGVRMKKDSNMSAEYIKINGVPYGAYRARNGNANYTALYSDHTYKNFYSATGRGKSGVNNNYPLVVDEVIPSYMSEAAGTYTLSTDVYTLFLERPMTANDIGRRLTEFYADPRVFQIYRRYSDDSNMLKISNQFDLDNGVMCQIAADRIELGPGHAKTVINFTISEDNTLFINSPSKHYVVKDYMFGLKVVVGGLKANQYSMKNIGYNQIDVVID